MGPPTERETQFTAFLARLVEEHDRAALAALRRGLGKRPGESADMYPYVVPWLPPDASEWREEAYYLVASLFAWHRRGWDHETSEGSSNFGASFARLSHASDSGSIERYFVALLNSHREDLPQHLRRAISLMSAHEVPVDWARLLRDIQDWDRTDRSVQREWARAYWGYTPNLPTQQAQVGSRE